MPERTSKQKKLMADTVSGLKGEVTGVIEKQGPNSNMVFTGTRLDSLFKTFGVRISTDALQPEMQYPVSAETLKGCLVNAVTFTTALNFMAESIERARFR